MKRTLLVILSMFFLSLMGCSDSEESTEAGNSNVVFSVLDSAPVSLNNPDRIIYVNYWAVWCGPCIEEMPILAEFNEKHRDRVEVYALNYDRPTQEQLRMDVEKLNVEIPSLLTDPGEYFGADRPIALPTTLIISASKVVDVLLGPQTLESLELSLNSIAP